MALPVEHLHVECNVYDIAISSSNEFFLFSGILYLLFRQTLFCVLLTVFSREVEQRVVVSVRSKIILYLFVGDELSVTNISRLIVGD